MSYPTESRRRLACDRCHAQKLRCLRSDTSRPNGECDRCLRASTPCVYSPPNRMGRPARSATSVTHKKSRSRQSPTTQREASRSPSFPALTPCEPSNNPSLEILPHTGMFEDFQLDSGRDFDLMSFLNDTTPFGGTSTLLAESSYTPQNEPRNDTFFTSTPNISAQEPITPDAGDDYVRDLIGLALSQYEQLRLVEQKRDCTSPEKQTLFTRLHSYPIGDMLENARKLTELIHEFVQASKRRESVPTVFWSDYIGSPDMGTKLLLDTGALSPSIRPDESVLGDFSDPLHTSDLATPTPTSTASSASSRQSTMSSGSTHMDTSTTLHVVSCYLRLARLFILFFNDLHSFLVSPHLSDRSRTEIPRLFPCLKLGSFQQFAGIDLEISLVVQVCEHMLSRLHSVLGLSTTTEITPVLVRAVQAQERLDTQDERGDTFTQLCLVIDGVKGLLKARPLL
ncbi:hypothetical protein AJ80_04885 [Polytolypa hystricis UAMH7299]|uniref:Zn(2)-C6 fungal-type domain-containing protein n=1 Tax=Polytolypa hystricis (strain UAMH7299) TaxID=1447883 RepID=A0A2B7Y880_POLH7|nr:hypothetical protein AJ80_04885 [Polytolypa hystricis UAMH7299]